MLVFNIIYKITLKRQRVCALEKRVQHYEAQALIQVQRVRRKEPMEKRYFTWLRYRLFRVKNLIAFDRVMDQIDDDGDEAERQYWERILDVLLKKLARTYQRKDNLQTAYFAYFIGRYEKRKSGFYGKVGRTGKMHGGMHEEEQLLLSAQCSESAVCPR